MEDTTIFSTEDVIERTYVVKTFDHTSQRYVDTATYANYDHAVAFATTVQSTHDVVIVSRKHIVTEVIRDEVAQVIPQKK